MKKKSDKSKSKEKGKKDDKKSKSSKSKKSSPSNSKEKPSPKSSTKNMVESINPDISGINKEPGQNNNLDITYTQYFSNRNLNPNLKSNDLLHNGILKCDGCYENEGLIYCKECKKYLCNLCDNQIHLIPANAKHLRVPINELSKMKTLCYHHQLNLEFFCESCDETICKRCQIIGPHNTNYHRIINIKDAFNKKFFQLSKMKPILINKMTELNYYNNKINELNEKVNKTKKELIRDIRTQYTAISEKIKDVEGKRNAILSFETSQLQYDSNNIQDIDNYIADAQSKKGINIINFLLQFPQFKSKIERILEKPLKEKIDLSDVEDYPNELEERHQILDDYDKIIKSLAERNENIWKILSEKKAKEKNLIDKARKKALEQIEAKRQLSDKYDKELKKYKVVCSYCGEYIDKKIINSECHANEQFCLNFYFTKEAPPNESLNTKKHYFGEPVSNDICELLKKAEKIWDQQRMEISRKIKEEGEKLSKDNNDENKSTRKEEDKSMKADRENIEGSQNFESKINLNLSKNKIIREENEEFLQNEQNNEINIEENQ